MLPIPTLKSAASPCAALKLTAFTKARVYWANPKPGTNGQSDFYSFDKSSHYQVADPLDYGIRGLKRMVDKMGVKVERCIIYDNQASGRPEICRKEKGAWNQ